MSEKRGKKRGTAGAGFEERPRRAGTYATVGLPQAGISSNVISDALTQAVLANPRHEAYAQAVADGSSYADAYRLAGYVDNSGNAHRVATIPAVAARIRMLRTAAAERAVQSIASRMHLLDSIVHADPSELTRLVVQPCGACWTDEALAAATVAYLGALGRAEAVEPPGTDKPRHNCARCAGEGVSRVVLTPTAELSAGARALFKSARQNAKGEIVIELHDRIAAINALNAMQDGALAATRSMNLNVNSFIPAARDSDYSPEELERLLASFSE